MVVVFEPKLKEDNEGTAFGAARPKAGGLVELGNADPNDSPLH